MAASEVSISIPEDLIKGLVLAEMTKALGNKEQLIAAVVQSAMTAKDPNNYGRTTLFETMVHRQIGEVATAAFKEWLDENVAKVKEAVLRELNKNKKKFTDQLVTALVDGRFYVKPTISVVIGTDER